MDVETAAKVLNLHFYKGRCDWRVGENSGSVFGGPYRLPPARAIEIAMGLEAPFRDQR